MKNQSSNPSQPIDKLSQCLDAYKSAVIHEYRFPDDVGTRLSKLATKSIKALVEAEIVEATRRERLKNLPITKVKLAVYLGVTRPTLDSWIAHPEKMTMETVKTLLELGEALKQPNQAV